MSSRDPFDPHAITDSREGIRWTILPRGNSLPSKADFARSTTTKTVVDGKVRYERKPLLAHQGDYWGIIEHPRARASRYVDVVRHDGHIVALVLTNASGDVGLIEGSNYGAYMKAKARHFGWFPIGSCVLQCVAAGVIHRRDIVDETLLEVTPCERGTVPAGGCSHTLAELAARRAAQARASAAVEEDLAEKETAGQRAIAAATAAASAAGIAEVLGPILAQLTNAITAPKKKGG